jgi:hypothetical protein
MCPYRSTGLFFCQINSNPPEFDFSGKKKSLFRYCEKGILVFVIQLGFEPRTVCLEGRCSIQLSYWTDFGVEKTPKPAANIPIKLILQTN